MVAKHWIAPAATGSVVIALMVGVSLWATRSEPMDASVDLSTNNPRTVDAPSSQRPLRSETSPAMPAAPSSSAEFEARVAANDAARARLANAGNEKLRSRFESERVDPTWASSKQLALEQLSTSPQIEQLNAKPLSIQARCRATACLIEANFDTGLAASDWHTLYTLNAGTEMSVSSSTRSTNPDGSIHLQIYGLAKQ